VWHTRLPAPMKILLQMPDRTIDAWHAALAAALPEAEIVVWPDATADPDYVLAWRPPDELFSRVCPRKAIFNLGAGVDALLAVPTLPRDAPVIRLTDAGMAEQMAEYVTLAVLRAYRETDGYAAQQREGRWRQRPRIAKDKFGVGVLGFGVLGQAIAIALAPFGFPLASWSRTRRTAPGVESFAGKDELSSFLTLAHVLVCTLPSTSATVEIVDRTMLSQLPRGAHLVNIARGDLVVDADLIEALDSGQVASATLDVFRTEPLPADHAFWHHPKVTMTPHISAVTLISESIAQIAAKIRRFEKGEAVTGVVDRDRGY
jgi:glyoxylate/hydroxypyruvate reductase